MILPDRRAWLFSAKTFAAAMLAAYVSLRFGLPRPYWAMATCYLVAQPWSGMARAKGLYRILGTLAGVTAAVVLVPNLVSAPPLLAFAMALWTALCLAASLLTQPPQNYAFLLAGYTAAFVGFPSVDQPYAIFATAVARAEEIGVGILSVLLVESVFPVPSAQFVLARLDRALADLGRLTQDVMRQSRSEAERASDAWRVAGDRATLGLLVAHQRYEPLSGLGIRDWVPVLHQRIRIMPLLLAGVADRAKALQIADPAALDALMPLLSSIGRWIERSAASPCMAGEEFPLLLARINGAASNTAGMGWPGLMRAGLLARLRALIVVWRASHAARCAIGTTAQPDRADRQAAGVWPPAHTDGVLVLLSGLAAFLAICGVCAFWIATAWPNGSDAAMMAAVGAALFAQLDEPGPAIGQFVWGVVASCVFAAVYLFVVLPPMSGFVPLVLVLAVLFLPAGAMQGTPELMAWGLPVTVFSATLIGLTAQSSTDFGDFANSSTAIVIGLTVAQVTMVILRPFGAAWRVHRLVESDRRSLAQAARGATTDRDDLVALMLDRFDAVAVRVPADLTADSSRVVALRIAFNVMELRQLRPIGDRRLEVRIERALRQVAVHVETTSEAASDIKLRAALDSALRSATALGADEVALPLAGLRRALLPDVPPPDLEVHQREEEAA